MGGWSGSLEREWKTTKFRMGTPADRDNIDYVIIGGRDAGFRGYTYKNNVKPGLWRVDVTTKEGLILGVIDFEIIINSNLKPKRVVERRF